MGAPPLTPVGLARDLSRSPALRAAVAFGLAGLGFAAGNLLLARALKTPVYGRLTLLIALLQFSAQLGPAGADGVVNRQRLRPSPASLRRACATSVTVGLTILIVGATLYGFSAATSVIWLVVATAGGVTMVAAAHDQSMQRFGRSLALSQNLNLWLPLSAGVALIAGLRTEASVLVMLAVGGVMTCLAGWTKLLRESGTRGRSPSTFDWREALSYLGVQAAGALLVQLDRLLIPRVLDFRALATFAVLASIAGAPFRMLQMGVGYTLLPRLRASETPRARRRVVGLEAGMVLAVVGVLSVGLWVFTIPLARLLLAGKYELTQTLVLAAILAGTMKVAGAFTVSAANALASTRQLFVLSLFGWLSSLAAVVGGALGARWGLAGAMLGVALGWLVRAAAAAWIALPYLVSRPGASGTAN